MVTYLYGNDTYRIQEYLKQHAPDAMVGEEALKTRGLFGNVPVILYEPDKKLKIPEDVEVFVISDKKPPYAKASAGRVITREFKALAGAEFKAWIVGEAKTLGVQIAPDAATLLAKYCTDSWRARLELEKLAAYHHGQGTITAGDVDLLVSKPEALNIFDFTDAMGSGDKARALIALSSHLASGADPHYLFSMIIFQFRNMMAPSRSGVHPYAAQKARASAKRFSQETLTKLYEGLYGLEIDVKRGIRDMTDGLYQFVFSLPSR